MIPSRERLFHGEAKLPPIVELERAALETVLNGVRPLATQSLSHVGRKFQNGSIARLTVRLATIRKLLG